MADISALGLQASDPLDLDTYKDAGEGKPFPPKGRYTLRAPESFTFGKTAAGSLSAQIDPTIVGPDGYAGQIVRFARVSATQFERGGTPASKLGDYLRAVGRRGKLSGDPAELADAVEQTAGSVYEAELDWRLFDKATGYVLKGMEKFPTNGNGGHVPYIESPSGEKDETGNVKRLRANLVIRRFIPASA